LPTFRCLSLPLLSLLPLRVEFNARKRAASNYLLVQRNKGSFRALLPVEQKPPSAARRKQRAAVKIRSPVFLASPFLGPSRQTLLFFSPGFSELLPFLLRQFPVSRFPLFPSDIRPRSTSFELRALSKEHLRRQEQPLIARRIHECLLPNRGGGGKEQELSFVAASAAAEEQQALHASHEREIHARNAFAAPAAGSAPRRGGAGGALDRDADDDSRGSARIGCSSNF
jgi:hypothetical protein